MRRESLRRRRDEVLIEITRPVRREPAGAPPLAHLQRSVEVAEFDADPREPCETAAAPGL